MSGQQSDTGTHDNKEIVDLVQAHFYENLTKHVSQTFLLLKKLPFSNTFSSLKFYLPPRRQNASSIRLMYNFQGRRCPQVMFYLW